MAFIWKILMEHFGKKNHWQILRARSNEKFRWRFLMAHFDGIFMENFYEKL